MEERLQKIEERNARVEADKAWETSWFRIILISVITYIVASLVLWLIGAENYLLGALIPTVGYFLSTLSIPFLKKWWINNYLNK